MHTASKILEFREFLQNIYLALIVITALESDYEFKFAAHLTID